MERAGADRTDRAAGATVATLGRPSLLGVVLDLGRHAPPVIVLYFRHVDVVGYLVLTAFDLALGLMLIVGTTRAASDPTTVDPRATWLISRLTAMLVLGVFLGLVAAVLTVPIAFAALVFGWASGVDWWDLASRTGFWIPVVVMCVLTGARAQHSFESVTAPGKRGTSLHAGPILGDLAGDRRRSKVAYAAQVTLIATYVGLSLALTVFGRFGVEVFPILYATLLVFYDARPDVAQRLFPELWQG